MLDDAQRRAVYIPEGLGHGFCALSDDATLTYLCSETYAPDREHSVHPLDAALGISWPTDVPLVSDRDGAAPTLAEATAAGLLPDYAACLAWTSSLQAAGRPAGHGRSRRLTGGRHPGECLAPGAAPECADGGISTLIHFEPKRSTSKPTTNSTAPAAKIPHDRTIDLGGLRWWSLWSPA